MSGIFSLPFRSVPATETTPGLVSLASGTETITGTDSSQAITPAGLTAKIDIDGLLAGNLDTRIPSQKAVKTYVDATNPKSSAGVVGAITCADIGSNQMTVSSVLVRLYKNATYTGPLYDYTVSGGTFTIPLNTTRYIVISYNNGTPQMESRTDVNDINESDIISVVSVVNDSSELHFRIFDYWAVGALNKHNQRLVFTRKYLRESGLSLSESGTRYINVSAGRIWYGIKKYITGDIATSAEEFLYRWFHDPNTPANWTNVKDSGSYNNTHYDDITDGLKEMTLDYFGVNWIYLLVADDEYEIMATKSRYEYATLPLAQASTIPPAPPIINSHCILVGRIIYVKGAATATLIESAYDTNFTGSQIADHESLTGLRGGAAAEHYHLTHAQHDTLTDGSNADALHIHNLKADKVLLPTNGNFAGLDVGGNLTDSGKKPADYSLSDHLHDSRYYTESEMDILLGAKSATNHTHAKTAITDFTETDYIHITGNETAAGNKTFSGNVIINGQTIRPFGGLTLSTTNNNVVIGDYRNLKISGPTANFTITGIAGGVDGRELTIYNPLAFRMSINNDDTGSLAANRILTNTGGNIQTTTAGAINLIYDGAASRWVVTGLQV